MLRTVSEAPDICFSIVLQSMETYQSVILEAILVVNLPI